MLGFSAIAESPISATASEFQFEVILTEGGVQIWSLATLSNLWTTFTRGNTWIVEPSIPTNYEMVYSSNEWLLPNKGEEWNI